MAFFELFYDSLGFGHIPEMEFMSILQVIMLVTSISIINWLLDRELLTRSIHAKRGCSKNLWDDVTVWRKLRYLEFKSGQFPERSLSDDFP